MAQVTLATIGPSTDLSAQREKVRAYMVELNAEEERRAKMTDAQRVAERLNSMFSREPGEAWHYEGDDWSKPEHVRWLRKAEALLERIPDPEEAIAFVRAIR